jgi:hypothetical protein
MGVLLFGVQGACLAGDSGWVQRKLLLRLVFETLGDAAQGGKLAKGNRVTRRQAAFIAAFIAVSWKRRFLNQPWPL